MIAYTPSLSGDTLSSGPGATGFYVEDPAREGEVPPVLIPNKDIPSFVQGQRLDDSDLVITFLKNSLTAWTPTKVTFAVGKLVAGVFTPEGSPFREPREIRVGKFAPLFQIGDNWPEGDYLARWSAWENLAGDPLTFDMLFRVTSAGVVNRQNLSPNFAEVSAAVTIE